ncbi:trehalose-phosphatase [Geotalea uraniireducens]|uniref:Trehalose-phosphatase n=1 Tax=Geotalea uraniireducens TaxID=351604 RepID=A0ABM8EMF9_9BACT|nr:trehalose-phosphatase [Geotalea uraniireducens]BDV43779.1 trehalose-phosphatase [Geotalea uraniireducens]
MTIITQRERLWIFAFDGTIVPAADRAKARLRQPIRQLLEELADNPRNLVALLSSRPLEDLAPRVPVPGIYLGGGCGAEWHTPDNGSMTLSGRPKERLMERREALLPLLADAAALPGIELEDHRWSVAITGGAASAKTRKDCADRLEELVGDGPATRFRRAALVEIPFIPEITMEFGVRAICRLLSFDGELICAGSEQGDAAALSWIIRQGGKAINIGRRPLVAESLAVADVRALNRTVRSIAGLAPAIPTRPHCQRLEAGRTAAAQPLDAPQTGCSIRR